MFQALQSQLLRFQRFRVRKSFKSEFNLELYSFWSESEINDSELQIDNSKNDSEFSSDDEKSVKFYTV